MEEILFIRFLVFFSSWVVEILKRWEKERLNAGHLEENDVFSVGNHFFPPFGFGFWFSPSVWSLDSYEEEEKSGQMHVISQFLRGKWCSLRSETCVWSENLLFFFSFQFRFCLGSFGYAMSVFSANRNSWFLLLCIYFISFSFWTRFGRYSTTPNRRNVGNRIKNVFFCSHILPFCCYKKTQIWRGNTFRVLKFFFFFGWSSIGLSFCYSPTFFFNWLLFWCF